MSDGGMVGFDVGLECGGRSWIVGLGFNILEIGSAEMFEK